MRLLRRISVTMSCLLFALSSFLMGLQYSGIIKQTEAITSTDTTSYVKVDELYNGSSFSETNLNTLLKYISGSADTTTSNKATIDGMASSKTKASIIRSKTYNKTSSQDVVVRFGGLDWQVVYLSKDTSGNTIITLWLTNCKQEAWGSTTKNLGNYHGLLNGGLYSDWSANWSEDAPSSHNPSNMYGLSYIRSATLNNGGSYASQSNAWNPGSQSTDSPFAKFTMSSVSGNVTEYLVKPANVQWQEYGQNTRTYIGVAYSASNENWSSSIPNSGSYNGTSYRFYYNSSKRSYYNYATKEENAAWKNDYIWLPSISETGDSSSHPGMWGLSNNQRKNFNGSTTDLSGTVGTINNSGVYTYSWTRSAFLDSSLYGMLLFPNGAQGDGEFVNQSLAVRPALHFNLSKAISTLVQEYTFRLDYNGGIYNDSSSSSQSGVIERGPYSFPVPVKRGYSLVGWQCTQPGYTNYFYNANADGTCRIDKVPYLGANGTKTFKAIWKPNNYELTLNANSGYFDLKSNEIISNLTYGPGIAKTETGGKIKGGFWAGDALYSVSFVAIKDARISLSISFDIKQKTGKDLYAVDFGVTQLDSSSYDKPYWTTKNLSGSTRVIFSDISAGSHVFYFYFFAPISAKFIGNNIDYEIAFDLISSSNEVAEEITKEVTYDEVYGDIPTPTKDGEYIFEGWWTSATGGTKVDTTGKYNIAGDSILYAHWRPKTYSIIFYGNGGSGSMPSQSVTYDAGFVRLADNAFVKEGYTFKHWSTSQYGGEIYLENSAISNLTANLTLYAQWDTTWHLPILNRTEGFQGNGDESSPYLISSAEDLAYLSYRVKHGETFGDKYFKQTRPIDLLDNIWLPIGTDNSQRAFKGVYDGQGFLISNLKTIDVVDAYGNQIYSNVGLFGFCNSAILKNINIVSGNVYGYENVGSLVGVAHTGLIENCRSGVKIVGYDSCGMIGRGEDVKVVGCFNYGNITGEYNLGGIIGFYNGTITTENFIAIENSFSKSNISGEMYIGGILGCANASVIRIAACGYMGDIVGGDFLGLIVGQVNSDIKSSVNNCFAKSSVWSAMDIENVVVNNSIYEIEGIQKHFIGSDFSAWIVTDTGQPLPDGLSWLARGNKGITTEDLVKWGFEQY